MAIAINGSTNVITGIGVGGLPDGIVDTDMLAANAVSSAKLASGVGGKILQVVTTSDSDRTAKGSQVVNNWASITGLSLAITPSSNTSKIKLSGYVFGEMNTTPYLVRFRVKRVISGGATSYIRGDASGTRTGVIGTGNEYFTDNNVNSTPHQYLSFSNYIDSPATTSAVTYTIEIHGTATATWYYNRTVAGSDGSDYEDGLSWITLEEVAA